jgi:hypothetical protein
MAKGGTVPGFAHADAVANLVLQLRWVHEWCFPYCWNPPLGTRAFSTIWYIIRGKVTVVVDRDKLELETGLALIVPPGVQLTGLDRKLRQPLHYLSLGADIRLGGVDFISLCGIPRLIRLPASAPFVATWQQLIDESYAMIGSAGVAALPETLPITPFAQHSLQPVDTRGLRLGGLARLWLAQLLESLQAQHPLRVRSIDPRISNALEFVRANLHRPLEIRDLAAAVYTSESNLRQLFQRELGVPLLAIFAKLNSHGRVNCW